MEGKVKNLVINLKEKALSQWEKVFENAMNIFTDIRKDCIHEMKMRCFN